MGRVVLVTGVARQLGGRVAHVLSGSPRVERVIGVDTSVPRHDLGRAEFVLADVRNPVIAKVVAAAEVDTVVHLSLVGVPHAVGGRGAMKETNVIGAMQLLAACQRTPTVRRLVVRSTTAVYGSSSRDPALFTEDGVPAVQPRAGFARDAVEVEGYVRGFARRRPDVAVTVLRLANLLGQESDSPFAGYFALPVYPVPLGFDPRLQFLHPEDATTAVVRAALADHPGTFNLAGEGVLLLSQAARRAGRPLLPVPLPAADLVGSLMRRVGLVDYTPDQLRFLAHGRGVDTTRARTQFGFVPERSTAEVFDEYVTTWGAPPVLDPVRLIELEGRLHRLLARVALARRATRQEEGNAHA